MSAPSTFAEVSTKVESHCVAMTRSVRWDGSSQLENATNLSVPAGVCDAIDDVAVPVRVEVEAFALDAPALARHAAHQACARSSPGWDGTLPSVRGASPQRGTERGVRDVVRVDSPPGSMRDQLAASHDIIEWIGSSVRRFDMTWQCIRWPCAKEGAGPRNMPCTRTACGKCVIARLRRASIHEFADRDRCFLCRVSSEVNMPIRTTRQPADWETLR